MNHKKLFLGVAFIGSVMVFSSCGSSAPISQSGQAKYREVIGLITHVPVTADLDVRNQKVQGTFEGKGDVDKKGKEKKANFDENACKSAATIDALEKSGADVIIAPVYSIEKKGNKIVVKVSGYPGFYKNFRPATAKDKDLLETRPSWLSRESSTREVEVTVDK